MNYSATVLLQYSNTCHYLELHSALSENIKISIIYNNYVKQCKSSKTQRLQKPREGEKLIALSENIKDIDSNI